MKTKALLLIIFITAAFCSFAQKHKPAAENGKCLLWRVSGNGITRPSYLFATVDFICREQYIWSKTTEDCYKQSNLLCLTLNTNDPNFQENARQALKASDNNRTMKDYFTPVEFAIVDRFFKDSFYIDLSRGMMFKPSDIQPLIAKRLLRCIGPPLSYDDVLLSKAKEDHKEVSGIETIQDEINIIYETNFDEKVSRIYVEMASGKRNFATYREKLEAAYQHRDLPAIYTISKVAYVFTKADNDVFLDKTSRRWAAAMPALMQKGAVFFALNAANFWGEEGLISLLRKAGYKVAPVYE